eukprot:SAG31_NODE_4123_length_3561_cov_3.577701_3_plen_72_part_00
MCITTRLLEEVSLRLRGQKNRLECCATGGPGSELSRIQTCVYIWVIRDAFLHRRNTLHYRNTCSKQSYDGM